MVAPIPEPWQAYVDDDSGETYYHNPLTSESVWELPTSPPPAAEAEPSPPPPTPSSAADTSPAGVLKAKLLTLISALPDRGRDATLGDLPPSVAIRDAVEELLPLDPAARDGWMESEAWSGSWELRYTSSRTFHLNDGLTGYAYKRPDCETPELLMRVDTPRVGLCTLEEPIVRPGAAEAAAGDTMLAECSWTAGAKDVLLLNALTMKADGREWSPRDPNAGDEVDLDAEKAIRVMAATLPVYLDESLCVLRSAVLDSVLFIWTREGAKDPPKVAVELSYESSDAVLERALAARDAGLAKGGRPGSHTPVGKIGNE